MRTLPLLLLLTACTGITPDSNPSTDDSNVIIVDTGESGGDDSVPPTDDSSSTDDSHQESQPADPIQATITGHLRLVLTTTDEAGDVVEKPWLEAFPSFTTTNGYPYGGAFIGAYEDIGNDLELFRGSTAVSSPDVVNGNSYSITVTMPAEGPVRVYAAVDAPYKDGIIATFEPSAIWPDELALTDGAVVNDVDLTIQIPWDGSDGLGGGGGGGGDCGGVDISGMVTVTQSWGAGQVAALLYDTNNNGPYKANIYDPSPITGGAESPYSLATCEDAGSYNLLGAWDSNYNGLIDPADRWGAYISAPDTNGNPITLSNVDLTGYEIQVPFGDVAPNVVPFVAIHGELSSDIGFDQYPAGSTVFVASLKYKPQPDSSINAMKTSAYDWAEFDAAALQAAPMGTTLPYSLVVPANSITYVWAFVDTNNNGVANETLEPVAGTNKMATGTQSQQVSLSIVQPQQ